MRGRFLTLAAAVLVAAVVAVLGVAVHEVRRPVSIASSGPYAVGRSQAEWADRSRIDPLAPLGGMPRVLSVWLWYPAVAGQGTPSVYAPDAWAGLHRLGTTGFGRISTGTRDDAPAAAGRFPIVVLLPELGLAAPQYAAIAAGLAARGYLVAGVTPTYSAALTVLNSWPVRASAAGRPTWTAPTVTSCWRYGPPTPASRPARQRSGWPARLTHSTSST